MAQKSPEELKAERAEAQKQLDALLSATRPKDLGQGVSSGISNIVAGAVGAAGVAVLAPTVGLAAGLSHGGLLGGIVGVTGGAVVGVLGAAALAVGGTVSGVVQIGRGVAAVPEALTAPGQGKWWSETQGKWVLTDMEKEAKLLEGVPEDDEDILGKVQQEIDASIEMNADVVVVDVYYYDCLEVSPDAEYAIIKRKYYILARKYHPDKTDDKEAAEKFKNIAEAYQVLSDPQLRAKYDKEGKEGLSPDKTTVAEGGVPKIDPEILFAFLFGSDLFAPYIGRLSVATSASIGDSPKLSLDDSKTLQKRRVARLAVALIDKIAPWVQEASAGQKEHHEIEAAWLAEAEDLSKASYGYQLVTTIGKIYNLMAIMYEGSLDNGQGLPAVSQWAAKNKAAMDKKNDASKIQLEGLKAGFDMMKIQGELKKQMQQAKTDEEREELAKKLDVAATGALLRILWTTTVVDITATIQETTQMVFFDVSVEKETRKLRAAAVKQLGTIWMNIAEPDTLESEDAKDARRLYEEAAFAAMLETVKRRDEAAHGSH